jgi:hypothetical protein
MRIPRRLDTHPKRTSKTVSPRHPLGLLSHLSQNTHFFEENSQKQGHFVPHCQKLSVGVKICQSGCQRFGIDLSEFARKMQKSLKCRLASRTQDMA